MAGDKIACPTSLAEGGRGFIEQVGFLREHRADALDLLVGFLPALLLDGLANAGDGLDAVAGVESGRVNHVTKPRAARQAGGVREAALALDELRIDGLGQYV